LQESSFTDLVITSWTSQPTAQDPNQLHAKMVALSKNIIAWKKNRVYTLGEQLENCLQCIQWIEIQAEQRVLNAIEKLIKTIMKERFNTLTQQEEQKWKQRAKKTWIELGDRNIKYFHQLPHTTREGTILTPYKMKATCIMNSNKNQGSCTSTFVG
jgi:gamma-glutamyl:cysteine ligase YbdK (ATP-grasp superfamily)